MFCLRYVATPNPGGDQFSEAGGAYVNCWVRAASQEEAQQRAVSFIRDSGWLVEALEEAYSCSRADFSTTSALSYFDEAEAHGESYVFHTWPPEPQGEDSVR